MTECKSTTLIRGLTRADHNNTIKHKYAVLKKKMEEIENKNT